MKLVKNVQLNKIMLNQLSTRVSLRQSGPSQLFRGMVQISCEDRCIRQIMEQISACRQKRYSMY